VREESDRREAVRLVADALGELGLAVQGFASSQLPGPKGNRETFIWVIKGTEGMADLETALSEVEV
jgi:23S rRNA (cytidine1920-2'-O)/16S rRNA (cytidine1409-2'-O)-methyltransferase